jgi:WD40 repeat protein
MVSKNLSEFHSKFGIVVDKSIDLVIPAHDTEIGAMAVNPDGTLLASASCRGHIIKIYSTDGGEVV